MTVIRTEPWGSVKRRARNMAGQIRSLIFPDKCLGCAQYSKRDASNPLSASFCPQCLDKPLPFFESPFCPVCGHVHDAGPDHLCPSCIEDPLALDLVRAAFEYKGVIRKGIGLFKYQARQSLARPFEHYLFNAFKTHFNVDDFHLILPIPLHLSKVRKRGFNQAYFLVRNFSGLYRSAFDRNPSWTIDIDTLVRVRATVSQTGLDHSERRKNLNQAFSCRHPSKVEGNNILLVDDVYTTGATCNAAAKTLIRSGASRVSALVLARA